MNTVSLLAIVTFGMLTVGGLASAGETWTLKAGKPLKVSGKLLDPLNVSGIASVDESHLILACDEMLHGVQAGRIDLKKGEISVESPEFVLLADNKKELDLESATADPQHHCYYTCGSCSVSRKKGKESPDRQWLFRMETDPKTGALLAGKVKKVSLRDAMNSDAFLQEHMDKPASELGIDVEGMAFKEGKLWFGLRSPNVNGWGFVVSASADDLVAGKAVHFQRFELPLGEDLGIRDLVPVKGGFLFIAGPTGAREKAATVEAAGAEKVETIAKPAPAKETPKETVATAEPAKETVVKAAPAKATTAKAAPAKVPAAKAAPAKAKETVAKAAPAKEMVAKAAPAKEVIAKPEPAKNETVAKPQPAVVPVKEGKAVYTLFFWPGDASTPVRIGDLVLPPAGEGAKGSHGKPEGLLVLNETAEKMDLIVVSDGSADGAPMLYELSRKGRVEGPVSR